MPAGGHRPPVVSPADRRTQQTMQVTTRAEILRRRTSVTGRGGSATLTLAITSPRGPVHRRVQPSTNSSSKDRFGGGLGPVVERAISSPALAKLNFGSRLVGLVPARSHARAKRSVRLNARASTSPRLVASVSPARPLPPVFQVVHRQAASALMPCPTKFTTATRRPSRNRQLDQTAGLLLVVGQRLAKRLFGPGNPTPPPGHCTRADSHFSVPADGTGQRPTAVLVVVGDFQRVSRLADRTPFSSNDGRSQASTRLAVRSTEPRPAAPLGARPARRWLPEPACRWWRRS